MPTIVAFHPPPSPPMKVVLFIKKYIHAMTSTQPIQTTDNAATMILPLFVTG